MTAASPRQKVLVLTDRPEEYTADLGRLGLKPEFTSSAAHLLERLLDRPVSGLVLELDKVMRSPVPERDQIIQLAAAFPVLRVLRKGPEQSLAYLDDLDCFSSLVRAFAPREVRSSRRAPVLLRGLLAASKDMAFESPAKASLLDISESGGYVSVPGGFGPEETVRLKIEGLEDRTPILASIRWRTVQGRTRSRQGLGLRFLEIRPGQMREIMTRFKASRGRGEATGASA